MIYKLGHIYAIWDCEDHNLIYYGSTKNLEDRIKEHKKRRNACTSKKIIERGNYEYTILESHENIDEYDLVERERWYIENKVCVNKCIPHRTIAEYRQDNKQEKAKQNKEYCQDNKEKIVEQRKEYYQNNKEKMAKKNKEYRQNNKEKIKECKKQHYEQNRDEILQKTKQNIRCPHCDKELRKGSLLKHIKKFCKGQITHQS
jgi:predicted GIY-YIG superfamily endonuclease